MNVKMLHIDSLSRSYTFHIYESWLHPGYVCQNYAVNITHFDVVASRVSQTGSKLKNYRQQAASKVKETGSTLGDLAQQSASEVQQTGQDIASTTQQTTRSMKQSE